MKRKVQVTWKLLTSFLLFAGLLGAAMWLLLALPAQAAPTPKSATAVSALDLCVAGGFNSWNNGGQPMYDDGTHGDLVAGDGMYSFAYTYASAGLQEWKVVQCGTWTGYPSSGNVWSRTSTADQEVTFLFDSNDHSADAGTIMLPAQNIPHAWATICPFLSPPLVISTFGTTAIPLP